MLQGWPRSGAFGWTPPAYTAASALTTLTARVAARTVARRRPAARGTNGAPARKPRPAAVSFRHVRRQGRASGAEPRAVRGNKFHRMKQQPYRPSTATGTRCAPGASRRGASRSSPRASPASWRRRSCSSGSSGHYQYRLAGTRLCELFGSELRGNNFLDGWSERGPPRARAAAGDGLRAGRGRPSRHRGRHRRPPSHRAGGDAAAAPARRQQDRAHDRRHERHLGAALARQRAPPAAACCATS